VSYDGKTKHRKAGANDKGDRQPREHNEYR
jgi:hypothetical protein